MRAILHRHYGDPEAFELGAAPKPVPGPGQILVQVRAAAVHADIWHLMAGKPYFMRLMGAGLLSPGGRIPGTDLSGVVEAVGEGVTRFKLGDAVYGEAVQGHQWKHGGTWAEFALAPETKLAPKPPLLGFESAAALPTAALIACQTVLDEARVQAGQAVLVNGAAGAVGSLVVQLAQAQGARVTAVELPGRLHELEALGADSVLDGSLVDFTCEPGRWDAIIDIPGNRSVEACLAAVKPGGRYVFVGHDGFGKLAGPWLGAMRRMLRVLWAQWRSGVSIRFPNPPDYAARMEYLNRLVTEGRLRVSVGRSFPLEEASEAMHCLMDGSVYGRIVLSITR